MFVETVFAGLLSIMLAFYVVYCMFGLRYGKKTLYLKNETYLPSVSMVIATFNEEAIVSKKLQNTLDLDYPEEKLEIIFVDSSTDRTREIIRGLEKKSNRQIVLVEEEERKGLASALNTGYSLATGEIVIKADCDLLLDNKAVKEIVKYFCDPRIGAVSGAIRVSNQSDLEKGYRTIFERLRLAEANLDSTYMFNPLSAFRKKLIQPVDTKSVADDAELALKIRRSGYRTIYSPTAIAYEESPTSIKERIKQKSRRAQGHIRLISQNIGMLMNRKYGKFGLVILPANFFMIMLSPWLILLTLTFGFIYLHALIGPFLVSVLALGFLVLIALVYLKSKPKVVAGFVDSQINLLVGFIKLIISGPDFKWTKDKRRN